MATGDVSPIVRALRWAQTRVGCEIRVHLSQRWRDRDPMKSAQARFARFASGPRAETTVLIYLNLRRRSFAILPGHALADPARERLWRDLAASYREDLLSTHFENATSVLIRTLGLVLAKDFPPPENPISRVRP